MNNENKGYLCRISFLALKFLFTVKLHTLKPTQKIYQKARRYRCHGRD